MTNTLFYTTLTVLGLSFGSFAGMLIYRLIEDKPFFGKKDNRSYCPTCHTTLKWYHNIPVLSWLYLRGKCGYCGEKISAHYLITEIVTTVLFITVGYFVGYDDWLILISSLIFTYLLIIISMTDIISGYIFDKITYPGIALGLAFTSYITSPIVAFSGACIGYGSLWSLNMIHKKLRGMDGMGYGDFKLAAMIGAFLGPYGILISFLIGPILSLVFVAIMRMTGVVKSVRNVEFTFGQYLATGAMFGVLFEPEKVLFFIQHIFIH